MIGISFGTLWVREVAGRRMYSAMRAVDVVLEPVDVVALAHPVLAALAEAALFARHDLFRDQPLAELEFAAPNDVLADFDGDADELVAGIIGALMYAGWSLPSPQNDGAPSKALLSPAQMPQASTSMMMSSGPARGVGTV